MWAGACAHWRNAASCMCVHVCLFIYRESGRCFVELPYAQALRIQRYDVSRALLLVPHDPGHVTSKHKHKREGERSVYEQGNSLCLACSRQCCMRV
jgi:hypothetical protein